jgi:TonB family protein
LLQSDGLGHSSVPWPLILWLCGVVLVSIPVVIGYRRIASITRRATVLEDEQWQALLIEECARLGLRQTPVLMTCSGAATPFTFGVLRPRILLPADCLLWKPLRRRAVLLHELAHIQRHDLVWQLFANIATSLWWFQPLCWWNRSNLRRESERACDAMVLRSGVLPSDYARELLAIAQTVPHDLCRSAVGLAMVQPGELESRLHAILRPPSIVLRKRSIVALAALIGVAVSASALSIFPEQSSLPGGYKVKRTLMSGLLASAGLSAVALGGPALSNNATAMTATQVPHYNAAAKDPRAGDDQSADQKVIRVKGTAAYANLIKKVQPLYPVSAKQAHIQGQVQLDVKISKEGVPYDLQVVSAPSDDLAQSAVEAVQQWRYRPTLLNGEPVAVVTLVLVNYTLSR